MAVELASAYVSLVPTFRGGAAAIAAEMGGPAQAAGVQAGTRFGTGFAGSVKKYAAVAGAAFVAAGVGLFRIGDTFDQVTDTIRVGTGATGRALDGLVASARNVGKDVPANFGDIGTAVADLNKRLGLTGEPLEMVAGQFLEMTRLTGGDLATNIASVTRLFGDWQIAAEDQSGTMDKLFRASQSTGIGIDRLSQLMVQFGSPMRQLGIDFDFATAMFARFEKEGVNIETLMPGLRMALKNFAKDGREPAEALMETFEAIKAAGGEAEANQLAFEVFGTRAGPDMAAAIREGRFDLEELMGVITEGGDTITGASEDTRDFAESWQLFKNRALLVIEPIAKRVFDILGTGMEWLANVGLPALQAFASETADRLRPALQAVGDFITRSLWPALQTIGGFITGAIIPALKDFAGWLKENHAWLTPIAAGIGAIVAALKLYHAGILVVQAVTKAWIAVQAALNAVLNANPIGLVVLALTGLAAALVWAWNHSETFRKVVTTVWNAVRDAVTAAWNWIRDKAIRPLVDAFQAAWNKAVEIKDGIATAWAQITTAVSNAWEGIKSVVQTGVRTVVDMFLGFVKSILDGAATAFGWIPEIGPKLENAAADFTQFKNDVNEELGGIKSHEITIGITGRRVIEGHFASGGAVFGAGTATSDSIVARLSNGEHVLTAREVQAAGGHGAIYGMRQALLAGRTPAFANGGPVDLGVRRVGASAGQISGLALDFVSESRKQLVESSKRLLAKLFDEVPKGKLGFPLPRGSYRVGVGLNGYPGHTGQDFPAPTGTPVYAPFSGAFNPVSLGNRSYGNYINLVAGGLRFIGAHLSGFARRAGLARIGDLLGFVGSTGNSTGPHLHAEFRKNGAVQNPRNYLAFDSGYGVLPEGHSLVYNGTGEPEPLVDPRRMAGTTVNVFATIEEQARRIREEFAFREMALQPVGV